MARFNPTKVKREVTTNLAGGRAFQQSSKQEYVAILLTSFVKNQYYRSADETIGRLKELIATAPDPLFAAKAAIFARNEFGMRSITHVAAAELAEKVRGESWVRRFIQKVVYRVDDMLEIASYYAATYGKKKKPTRHFPNAMKKGFRDAFAKFDGYQIAKYKGEGKQFKLIDLVNLIHPKASEKNAEALSALVKDTLKSTETWEAKLSESGQKATTQEEKAELKAEAWKELLESRKIGYFALLRNLRNIIEQAPTLIKTACELLMDSKLIKKSLVLPFRFSTAYEEIQKFSTPDSRKVLQAIGKALDISCSNVPQFPGKTLVALDVSGSMSGKPSEIAGLFAAVIVKSNNADILSFDGSARWETYNPDDSTMTIRNSFRFSGGSTNFDSIFNLIQRDKRTYDRIIILSDMQAWVSENPYATYVSWKKISGCDPFIYCFDLAGHGTTQFVGNKALQIAGFSEKILEIMSVLEQDRDALVKKIEAIDI